MTNKGINNKHTPSHQETMAPQLRGHLFRIFIANINMRKGKDLADRSSRFNNPSPNQYTDQVLLDLLNVKKIVKFGGIPGLAGVARNLSIKPQSINGVTGTPFPYSVAGYAVTDYIANQE